MTRSRATAKKAGTWLEALIATHLAAELGDDRIERRAKTGARDRGDIGGVRLPNGGRVVIECKNVARTNLAGWITEAETERGNDDAAVGLVIHKRTGTQNPNEQYVTMTVANLVTLLRAGIK